MNSNINVITVDKDSLQFNDYCEKIYNFCETLPEFKLIENYQKHLDIEESLAVSVYQVEEKILGFSTVFYREMFHKGVRILNRFVKSSDYRFVNQTSSLSLETKTMIEQQIDVAKKFNFDYVFMSRESKFGASSLRRYLNFSGKEWIYTDDRYYVCKSKPECRQYIAWLPLKENSTLTLVKSNIK
jgi:hypothetical protein